MVESGQVVLYSTKESLPATHDTTTKVKAEEHAHTVNWCMAVWCKLGQPSETACGCPGGMGSEME